METGVRKRERKVNASATGSGIGNRKALRGRRRPGFHAPVTASATSTDALTRGSAVPGAPSKNYSFVYVNKRYVTSVLRLGRGAPWGRFSRHGENRQRARSNMASG